MSFVETNESPTGDGAYQPVVHLSGMIQSLINEVTEKDFFIPFHKILHSLQLCN